MLPSEHLLLWLSPQDPEPGAVFSSHSEQHTMHAHASMFYSELLLKNLTSRAGDIRDAGLIPGSGKSPGVRNSQTLSF